jgi:hypothetical protein
MVCTLMVACSGGSAKRTNAVSTSGVAPNSSASTASSPPRTEALTTGPGVKPGETPPELDPLGTNDDEQGALDFAAYFIKALDWSIATNDPVLIRQVALPSCTTCSKYIAKLDAFDGGTQGYVSGGRISITSIAIARGTSSITADQIVELTLFQEPDVIHRPSVAPSTETPSPASVKTRIYLSWVENVWKVVEMAGPE